VSSNAKWVVSGIFAIVGVLALAAAVIYLTVPIHSLPSFMPGQHSGAGTYHKRGAIAAVIAVVLLVIAIVVGLGARSAGATAVPSSGNAPLQH
jgi:uncharacterized membrane protein